MKRLLLKQATYLPLIYFIPIILAGLFASDYHHVGQHVSELALTANSTAVTIFNIGMAMTGISLILFGTGLLLCFKGRFILSAVLTILFGITFVFNAIFLFGSPWHGLYGIGMCVMLIPFIFLYEQKGLMNGAAPKIISIIVGLLSFLYFWSMVVQLDPVSLRGLTQRLFATIVFGWYAFVSFKLSRIETQN